MDKDWVKVYTTEDAYTAEILKQGLEESEIPVVVINKKISAYNLGLINILVHPDFIDKATAYILENDI